MTDKKEQAMKLREAAETFSGIPEFHGAAMLLRQEANELDPPLPQRWEWVRAAAVAAGTCSDETYWKAAIGEANNGMVSKDELKKRAPWFSGSPGPNFSPSSYDQGITAFLRVLESL